MSNRNVPDATIRKKLVVAGIPETEHSADGLARMKATGELR